MRKKQQPKEPKLTADYLRIGLGLADIEVNNLFCDIVIGIVNEILKNGGDVDLKTTSKIAEEAIEKHKSLNVIYPNYKAIENMKKQIASQNEKFGDIHQWSNLILQNNLRPRVLRTMVGDINNRCTD